MMISSHPIILALSGGGFRATLFHLGILRFLYAHRRKNTQSCLLTDVSNVVAVSGGSILAASLVQHFDEFTGSAEEFGKAAAKVVAFTKRNIQRQVLIGGKSLFRNHAQALADLYGDATLSSLDPRHHTAWESPPPHLHLMVTDLANGCMASLSDDGIRTYSGWAADGSDYKKIESPQLKLADAVAASSAFPMLVPPCMAIDIPIGSTTGKEILSRAVWADGGIYDNTGLDFVRRFIAQRTDKPLVVLASNAGKPFGESYQDNQRERLVSEWMGTRVLQTIDVQMQRLAYFDRLHFNNGESYYVVDCSLQASAADGHAHDDTDTFIDDLQNIRTDLDGFSNTEAYWLVRRGYVEAQRKWGMLFGEEFELISDRKLDPFLDDLTAGKAVKQAKTEELKAHFRSSTSYVWAVSYWIRGLAWRQAWRHPLLSTAACTLVTALGVWSQWGGRPLPPANIANTNSLPKMAFVQQDALPQPNGKLIYGYDDFVNRSDDDFNDGNSPKRWLQFVQDHEEYDVEWECVVYGKDTHAGLFRMKPLSAIPSLERHDVFTLKTGELFDLEPDKPRRVTVLGTIRRVTPDSVSLIDCKIK